MVWQLGKAGGICVTAVAIGLVGCGREEPVEDPPSKVTQAVTEAPCSFTPPADPGTPRVHTFTLKLPNGTSPEEFALATAGGRLTLQTGVTVVNDSGGYASVASVGATSRLLLQTGAKAGSAYSELTGIELQTGARLYGSAKTASTVIESVGAVVEGQTLENASLRPLSTTSWSVEFPGNTSGNCTLPVGQTQILDPGSYGTMTAQVGAHLHLRSGTYFFRSLALQTGASLEIDNSAGPVYIYVRDGLSFSGSVVLDEPHRANVLFAYAGSSSVTLQPWFRGILVAPAASVTLGPAGSTGHTGAFFAKTIVVQTGSTIHHRAFASSNFCEDSTACTPLCPCGPGGTCQSDADCQAGQSCSNGTCQAPDDGNPCTTDTIDANGTVQHVPVPEGTSCSDGNACNGAEVCNASAQCLPGTPPVVDDGNPCTVDACAPATAHAAARGHELLERQRV